MRFILTLILFVAVQLALFSQGRKLPNFTFKEHSTEFANANRKFDEDGQMTDTLTDESILNALIEILKSNETLLIEVGGHTASNEDVKLGLERANKVMKLVVAVGVKSDRLRIVNYAHTAPLIDDKTVLSLPTREERNAANQRNRRVEIKVIGNRPPKE